MVSGVGLMPSTVRVELWTSYWTMKKGPETWFKLGIRRSHGLKCTLPSELVKKINGRHVVIYIRTEKYSKC